MFGVSSSVNVFSLCLAFSLHLNLEVKTIFTLEINTIFISKVNTIFMSKINSIFMSKINFILMSKVNTILMSHMGYWFFLSSYPCHDSLIWISSVFFKDHPSFFILTFSMIFCTISASFFACISWKEKWFFVATFFKRFILSFLKPYWAPRSLSLTSTDRPALGSWGETCFPLSKDLPGGVFVIAVYLGVCLFATWPS